jgi:fatty-acyl-CoA synthase
LDGVDKKMLHESAFAPADWVEHHSRVKPGGRALHSVDSGETRSWLELEQRVGKLAHALRVELGIRRGERVATLMNGDIRSFELQFACMRAGIILAPLNFRLAAPELALLCRELEPALMISDPSWSTIADSVVSDVRIPRRLMTAVGGGSELDSLIEAADIMPAKRDVNPNDVTHILFTSGTTGTPKGALFTHSTLMWQALNQIQIARVAEEGTHVFTPAPVFHAGGLNSLSNPALFFGGQVSIASRFEAGAVVDYIGNPANGVTHLGFGPVMYQFMSEAPEFQAADFSAVRLALIAGGRVPESLRAAYERKNVFFSTQYGATETGPTVTALNPAAVDKVKEGSCGQAVMHVEIRLVDETGKDVRDSEAGEVWVKGPAITAGYWKRDPSAVFTNGWFRTGDIARRDADGFYFIVDRIKDMYKSGGENVSSVEVEAVLMLHPSIAECAVVGVPDPKWGEVGLAIIRPHAGCEVSMEVVQAACAGQLARYKHPRYIQIVDHFPRNVTGKISKADLRRQFGGTRSA